MKTETVEERALDIAAKVLVAAGVCRYDSPTKCRRVNPPSESDCDRCVKSWLLSKARKEMRDEGSK